MGQDAILPYKIRETVLVNNMLDSEKASRKGAKGKPMKLAVLAALREPLARFHNVVDQYIFLTLETIWLPVAQNLR